MRLFGCAALAAIVGAAIGVSAIPVLGDGEDPAPPDPAPDVPEVVPNSHIIFLKPGANAAKFRKFLAASTASGSATNSSVDKAKGGKGKVKNSVQKEFNAGPAKVSVLTGLFDEDFISEARTRPEVADVFPNLVHTITGNQVDPPNAGLPQISSRTLNSTDYLYPDSAGQGVTAYIIDTGIRVTHEDFGGRASFGVTTVDNTTDANDDHGHGTHVSGIVGGTLYGVAKNVNLVAVKVCSFDGRCTTQDIVEGIIWVINDSTRFGRGKTLANLSIGGAPDSAMDQAVQIAMSVGVPFVVSAGNNNADACNGSPGRVPGALTVAATDAQNQIAYFSNYGTCVDIFAPGVAIMSTSNGSDNATAIRSGTSMSSPFTAGVVALVASTGSFSVRTLSNTLISMSTKDVVQGLQDGTPNRLLYNGGGS